MPFPERIGPTTLTGSNTTIFTANRPIILKNLIVVNTDATNREATINLVPSGSSAAQGNRLVPGTTILANDLLKRDLDLVMDAGDTLQGLGSLTGVLNVFGTFGDEKKLLS